MDKEWETYQGEGMNGIRNGRHTREKELIGQGMGDIPGRGNELDKEWETYQGEGMNWTRNGRHTREKE